MNDFLTDARQQARKEEERALLAEREIRAIGAELGFEAEASEWVRNGLSPEQFQNFCRSMMKIEKRENALKELKK